MGKEPLSREEYNEAVEAYTDEYRNGVINDWTFRLRLRAIGCDTDEIDYLVRINRPS